MSTIKSETIRIAPGHLVANVSTASGGVRYQREHLGEHHDDKRLETEFKTNKVIDNVDVVKLIDGLVKDADYALRANSVRTSFGFFATDEQLVTIQRRLEGLRLQMHEANLRARAEGSAHQGRIGIVAARLDLANPDTIRECYRAIRETLQAIHDALLAGDVTDPKDSGGRVTGRNQLRPALLRARNLEAMAVGLAGEAIKSALACAKDARAYIVDRVKNGASPEEAGRSADLTAIETAITWFGEDGFGDPS